jgi:spermidine/putrescine transport system substrate-binding protein
MPKISRVFIIMLLCLIVGVPVLAQDATAEPVAPWVCPEGFEGQTLNVFNWSIYVAEDTISNFEKACGITVVYDIYYTNEELVTKLRNGNPGYDVIVPSDYMIAVMIGEELLEPLDKEQIPNFANISEDMKNPWYDPDNQFTVPYQWGTMGIAYNKTAIGHEVTSWEEFFNYEGRVAWLEDLRGMFGVGLLKLGLDPNSESEEEINAAKEYLIEHGSNVVAFVQGNSKELLSRNEVDMLVDYNGNVFGLIAECEADPNCTTEYAYTIPEEGTNRWTDNLAIPVGASNIPLAHVFIDYILDPKVGADISNYVVYGTPNQAALDQELILPEYRENPAIYPSDDVRSRLFQIMSLPDAETFYNNAWDELKISLG